MASFALIWRVTIAIKSTDVYGREVEGKGDDKIVLRALQSSGADYCME